MAQAAAGLSPVELAAAHNLLGSVQGLRDALHQLEYLTRLPHHIEQAEARKTEVDGLVQVAEQQLATVTNQIEVRGKAAEVLNGQIAMLEIELAKTQAYLASEQTRMDTLRMAKDVLRKELVEGLQGQGAGSQNKDAEPVKPPSEAPKDSATARRQ